MTAMILKLSQTAADNKAFYVLSYIYVYCCRFIMSFVTIQNSVFSDLLHYTNPARAESSFLFCGWNYKRS